MDFLFLNLATERPITHLRSSSKIKTVLSTCTVIDGASATTTSIMKGCLQFPWKPCSLLCVYSIRKSRIKSNLSANKERALILYLSLEFCNKIDRIRVLVAFFCTSWSNLSCSVQNIAFDLLLAIWEVSNDPLKAIGLAEFSSKFTAWILVLVAVMFVAVSRLFHKAAY